MESKGSVPADDEPREGWSSEAYVHRVIDGDTIEVEVRRRFAIRLTEPNSKSFNVPEKNTNLGKQATEFLNEILLPCFREKNIKIFIPAGQDNIKLMDINSFNRLLGEIWVDGKRLTNILREKGYVK